MIKLTLLKVMEELKTRLSKKPKDMKPKLKLSSWKW